MKVSDSQLRDERVDTLDEDDGPEVGLLDLLTWIGEGKKRIAIVTVAAAIVSLVVALVLPPVFTARTTLLPPGSQQQSGAAAALAALGSLSGLAGSLGGKTPDEMYVTLLKSDSVTRALDQRFGLRKHYDVKTGEALRKVLPKYVHVAADKKSGVIDVEVDDESAAFAAELANAFPVELNKLLDRVAVSEAQQRRIFYEQQLKDTKENLIKAEQTFMKVQEKSGVIVLDKQAEALITTAAQLRVQIAEREVRLQVLRTSATARNPDVQRLESELAGLKAQLARMEDKQNDHGASAIDLPVGNIPEAALDYIRAKRELKLQETLLEGMVRQYEIAKLDEAKEGTGVQQVDLAVPPDYKSKPSRALVVIAGTLLGLIGASAVVVWRRYSALLRESDPQGAAALDALRGAWRLRRRI